MLAMLAWPLEGGLGVLFQNILKFQMLRDPHFMLSELNHV